MKVDNPLSREFLLHHAAEAARVLEQVSAENIAAFFRELPPQTGAPAMASMLPEFAANCLGKMDASPAAALVAEMPVSPAARIYRLLSSTQQVELFNHLSDKSRNRIRRLRFPQYRIFYAAFSPFRLRFSRRTRFSRSSFLLFTVSFFCLFIFS